MPPPSRPALATNRPAARKLPNPLDPVTFVTFGVRICGEPSTGGKVRDAIANLSLIHALAHSRRRGHVRAMASLLSVLIGFIALILMIPTVIPFLGWLNWLFVPIALFGAGVGSFARGTGARNFCLGVAALGGLRLFIGGGFI